MCIFIGFPVAYFLAFKVSEKWRAALLAMVVIPSFTSFLIRTVAWKIPLAKTGYVSRWLQDWGLLDGPIDILQTPAAVQLAIVYNYLGFVILPLFVALDRIDVRMREASKDLGAGRLSTLAAVTLPLAGPGVAAAVGFAAIAATRFLGGWQLPESWGIGRTAMHFIGPLVIFGKAITETWLGGMLTLSRMQLVIALGVYGFAASVLPVWMLLAPRDYLSSFMKIGTIIFLVIGVIIVNPVLQMPAFSGFTGGGGPIVPGALFPFAFITIACGAISGFHALIGSGTTPKMIDKESDIRPIGYGSMLIEGLVAVMALIAASAMHPGDYYAINTSAAVFETLNQPIVNLPELESAVGESVAGLSLIHL